MQVVYTGPIDAVEIAELGLIAPRDEAVEVPDELGERLCQQSCWQHAQTGPKPVAREEHS